MLKAYAPTKKTVTNRDLKVNLRVQLNFVQIFPLFRDENISQYRRQYIKKVTEVVPKFVRDAVRTFGKLRNSIKYF